MRDTEVGARCVRELDSGERRGSGRSRRLCMTAARFGLSLPAAAAGGGLAGRAPDAAWLGAIGCAALVVDALLAPGEACLIVGPSGGGKTTLLRRIAGATPSRVIDVDAPRFRALARSERAVVDLFSLPLDTTLRLLAAAGLAEAPLLVRAARALSEGQRFRLRLALAMAAALRAEARGRSQAGRLCHVTLIADEFCASLDASSAASVCIGLSRWLGATRMRLIAATPREDLLRPLRPQLIAATSLYNHPEVRHVLRLPSFRDESASSRPDHFAHSPTDDLARPPREPARRAG